jgi:hypothetical protein
MLIYNAARQWPTASALALKFEQQSSTGQDALAQLQHLGAVLLVALGGGEESFGGSNPVQSWGLALALVIGLPLIALASRRGSTEVPGPWGLSAAVLLAVTVIGFIAAHGSARYLLGVLLAGCAFAGALLGWLSQRATRAGPVIAAIWILLCAVPNVASYGKLDELMAPEQLSLLDQTTSAIQALEERGLTRGYADYWTAYPITYVSGEHIIVAPSLPFMYSSRVDRYPAYTNEVDAVDTIDGLFLLVDSRCSAQPYVDSLAASGAAFRTEQIARWILIWDIQPTAERNALTLTNLRATIASQPIC